MLIFYNIEFFCDILRVHLQNEGDNFFETIQNFHGCFNFADVSVDLFG